MGIDIRDAFFDKIYDIAAIDKEVIFITADADAFSLKRYKKDFPERFINVGVAEQNMVTLATGLALSGKKVFIYAILSFTTMRCYEQIKFNICSMNLPITIIGVGSGLAFGFDGPTHHGVGDIGIMRMLPEMTIYNPSTPALATASAQMSYKDNGPCYVRIDKGPWPEIYNDAVDFSAGFSMIKKGSNICIVATGIMTHKALEVAQELSRYSINAAVIDLYRLKPINNLLFDTLNKFSRVITLEENSIVGGIGSIISEIITDHESNILLKRIALKDEQCLRYGEREWLHEYYKIDVKSVVKQISTWK